MKKDLFHGDLVRLTAEDPAELAPSYSRWMRDSEYWRLLASDICQARSAKSLQANLDKELDKDSPRNFYFQIRTLAEDRLIGDVGLDEIVWSSRETFVGIGIGERDFWSKGYGTEAMQLILRFAFCELNLNRVALDVFEYNPRAIRSYEKVGFTHEGRMRKLLLRDGRRWDLVFMGILREEWERKCGYVY